MQLGGTPGTRTYLILTNAEPNPTPPTPPSLRTEAIREPRTLQSCARPPRPKMADRGDRAHDISPTSQRCRPGRARLPPSRARAIAYAPPTRHTIHRASTQLRKMTGRQVETSKLNHGRNELRSKR